jgi:predicted dehydrogenase
MQKTYNWAILGCGRIARKFSSDLKLLPNARLYATASRDSQKAKDFAAEFGFEKAFGSYHEMLADPAVDVVYIATPHIITTTMPCFACVTKRRYCAKSRLPSTKRRWRR